MRNNNSYQSPIRATSRRASTTHTSPFFRDLASPIPSSSRYNPKPSSSYTPTLPPPPPLFSLEDDLSPEPEREFIAVASPSSRERTWSELGRVGQVSSFRARLEEASGSEDVERRKAKGKAVAEEVETGAVILHPMAVDNESKYHLRRNEVSNGGMDEEEWITVYGFYPSDTNTVLREFEKCGVILRHITGPRDANWLHILYQNRYDARRALERNATYITNSAIIGVKLVDQMEKKILNEKINENNPQSKIAQHGFMVSNNLAAVRGRSNTVTVSGRAGNVAVPDKSIMTKAMDFVFGM